MEAPIEDAVTVAYVDVVHALSELDHLDWNDQSKEILIAEVDEAMADLRNALVMLNPHVRKANPAGLVVVDRTTHNNLSAVELPNG